jgi:FHA domain
MDALSLLAGAVPPPAAPAVLDVLDRDGQVRQTLVVHHFPLRIGRALDNDVVLADPHVAPHHVRIDAGDEGLQLVVGDTRNGVLLGALRLAAGEARALPAAGAAIELTLGRTALRLRLPGHTLAAELPLAAAVPGRRHAAQIVVAAVLMLAGLLFDSWLDNDPDGWPRTAISLVLGSLALAAVWAGAWALLSKTFTRVSRFSWHLRVFLLAVFALQWVGVLPHLLAFVFSWPALASFGFIATYAVAGVAFYCHLLAVEPQRPRLMRGVALAGVAAAIGLSLWQNQQRGDRLGDALYMSHLFPPALRVAQPVNTDTFMQGVVALQAGLDKSAKDKSSGDAAGRDDE